MIDQNLGIRIKQQLPNDYQVGGITPLASGVINPSGDWTAYLPVIEYQNNRGFDRLACVTYSLLNCLEILYLYKTQKEINFSDRFLAKASNTTLNGNWADVVFDTARKEGLVTEGDYPDTATNWNDYYKPLSPELYQKAEKFLDEWELFREWVPVYKRERIFDSLKEAPLQVFVKYASGNGILNPEGQYNHAVTVYNAVWGEYWEIYDHYTQTRKKYAWDYEFGVVLKPTMNLKIKYIPMTFKQNFTYLVNDGDTQRLGMFLDGKMVIYDDKVDTLLNSASRLKKYEPAIPVLLKDWNGIDHINGKGELIKSATK